MESGRLSVRHRKNGDRLELSEVDLAEMIRDQVHDMPHRPLPLPERLSRRPTFCG